MTTRMILILPALAFLAAACGKAGATSDRAAIGSQAQNALGTAKVEATTVSAREVPSFISLTGTLNANHDSDVASDIGGKVAHAQVERGTEVKSGAPLVALDPRTASFGAREARAQAEAAKARATLMQDELKRSDELFHSGAINASVHDRATTEALAAVKQGEAAEAMADRLEKSLADTTVRAPFDGVVVERLVDAGEYVNAGAKVARVVQIDPLRLELAVPEAAVRSVKEGLPVEFEVAAWPGEKFRGVIRYVSPALRESSRDLVVEAEVPNKDHRLRPGMFAVAKVAAGGASFASVPTSAIKHGDQTESVFIIEEGRLQERIIQVGERVDDHVAVLSGIRPGETVVARVTDGLQDGQKVQ
jgi:membrane fusion protein (multidrug efflux system)